MKITQYPAVSGVATDDVIVLVHNGVTMRATVAQLIAIIDSQGGASPVDSVNGMTGDVVLTAADIGSISVSQAMVMLAAHNADAAAHGGVQAAFAAHLHAGGTEHPLATNALAGFMPALPNDPTKFLNGQGAFTVPAGGGGSAGTLDTSANVMMPAINSDTSARVDFGSIDTADNDAGGAFRVRVGGRLGMGAGGGAVSGDVSIVLHLDDGTTNYAIPVTLTASTTINAGSLKHFDMEVTLVRENVDEMHFCGHIIIDGVPLPVNSDSVALILGVPVTVNLVETVVAHAGPVVNFQTQVNIFTLEKLA